MPTNLWRRNRHYKTKHRSIAAEEKLVKMLMEGWTDRDDNGEGIRSVPLLLLYIHQIKWQA